MRKAFDWKRSRISMLEVEAVPQSCIPLVEIGLSIVLYMRSLFHVESFHLRQNRSFAESALWTSNVPEDSLTVSLNPGFYR
jgi:hypothetical protein